ncbi:N-terminal Xaa-Pro-Lys N-methyltransferase 1-A-like [Zerene cesonia]|uniref:N-terminal Xaa-Pro-Lys N-methyltransferase 1-A-like n=1 Tax=Zerene cesonia TaxID=33412 RepID=UPI0018E519D9|nr:N-terminal Xaa-Pro-Lys N-methyltransferase 1-A-like [Zerene cesonia]
MDNIFYKDAARYWANVPSTIDGVLGGFGHIADIDIAGSKQFLDHLLSIDTPPATKRALDCGAGIGRVSKNLLIPYFDKVDLVEQDEKFINTAKQTIGDDIKLGILHHVGLQNFKPQEKYDVIWCQWVLGHLNDYDLIGFLERCRQTLAENGLVVIKENITTSDDLEYDDVDSSVTRPIKLMLKIFEEANLEILRTEIQTGFPDDIYPVHMFALKPS